MIQGYASSGYINIFSYSPCNFFYNRLYGNIRGKIEVWNELYANFLFYPCIRIESISVSLLTFCCGWWIELYENIYLLTDNFWNTAVCVRLDKVGVSMNV